MPTPDLCIYHGNCADGFTAAWVVWRCFGNAVEFLPGIYGAEPPDVTGRHVVLVDFSYKRPVLARMAAQAASLLVLDHHKTAAADLDGFAAEHSNATVVFDMNRSGARLAWEHFHGTTPPTLVRYVEDRDLWRFLLPGSREVAAFVFSYGYSFRNWDYLHALIGRGEPGDTMGLQQAIDAGGAIERKHHKDIAELLAIATRRMVIGGHSVPVANLPYTMASDAGQVLAKGEPFGACYFDRADARVFSLRSTPEGVDVSEIAARYGGGGHRNAAGFQMPLGWDGDEGRSDG
ncbi:phosphohydrolase [Mycobacterium sp. KBS0706]|uniref:DHH family phosphoesterase n=1 Tax=Mycobacterium sp. KBS0706 TaxID=2578109 RepID=UPI00110F7D94|nr:DHHA1 domain-containing protein [Mycobacterium sp. KBS0706]TSD89105.1 phosphohydrolase [Mycobacterium sp. KBS0706]